MSEIKNEILIKETLSRALIFYRSFIIDKCVFFETDELKNKELSNIEIFLKNF